MPYLSFDSEYCELRFGANLLGGRGEGSVLLSVLALLPPTALILVGTDGRTTIRRLPSRFPVRVDGEILGSASMELLDNSHLEVGEHRLIFNLSVDTPAANGAHEVSGGSSPTAGAAGRPSSEHPIPDIDPNDLSPWLLREMRTGRTVAVPRAGMLIGRSEDCHLVVTGRGVSRKHALIEPYATGFAISDLSANGTLVNRIRSREHQALAAGDILRIGDEDYRVENGSATRPPHVESQRATEFVPTVAAPVDDERPEQLASLEVSRGALRGTYYSIERAVCAIGSSRANDLRLADPSVAPSHATLLLKGETWYVTDLRSRHGTFVNGYRVATERALAHGCTLTVGHVTLVFRAKRSIPALEPEQPEGWFTRFVNFLRAS
ncbi:MAG TPA: FHA domain-containing protein [Gemmatimonadaceae bacterium]|jgi:pSer/pThr/pTyr-binding forkhead associated (FHA) protein